LEGKKWGKRDKEVRDQTRRGEWLQVLGEESGCAYKKKQTISEITHRPSSKVKLTAYFGAHSSYLEYLEYLSI
jgi:hypothetical protein